MRRNSSDRHTHPVLIFWLAAGWAAFLILPWYGIEDFWTFEWLVDGYPWDSDYAPTAFLIAQGRKLWLAPLVLPLVIAPFALRLNKGAPAYARILIGAGALGLGWLIAQGFGIGLRGWQFGWLEALFGPLGDRQFGMGYGALLLATAFLFLLTQGIAARGAINGDVFVVSSIGFVIAVVSTFVFFPIARMLVAAFITDDGGYSVAVFFGKFLDPRLWSLSCLTGGTRCGVAWNSLLPGRAGGFPDNGAGSGVRAGGDTFGLPLQARAAGPHRPAHHHATVRDRARHHSAVRAFRLGDRVRRRPAGDSADTLGLRPARHPDRPDCWPSRRSPFSS